MPKISELPPAEITPGSHEALKYVLVGRGIATPGLANLLVMVQSPETPEALTTKITIEQLVQAVTGTIYSYRANLSQVGESAPIVAVLHSTIGEINWARIGPGRYSGTLANGFPTNRTFILLNRSTRQSIGVTMSAFRANESIILLETRMSDVLADSLLLENSLELLIYPP